MPALFSRLPILRLSSVVGLAVERLWLVQKGEFSVFDVGKGFRESTSYLFGAIIAQN